MLTAEGGKSNQDEGGPALGQTTSFFALGRFSVPKVRELDVFLRQIDSHRSLQAGEGKVVIDDCCQLVCLGCGQFSLVLKDEIGCGDADLEFFFLGFESSLGQ